MPELCKVSFKGLIPRSVFPGISFSYANVRDFF